MKRTIPKSVASKVRTQFHRRYGATMVEMAIVVPVFLLVIFAGLEFTRISMMRNAANNAAYEAARTLIIPGARKVDAENEADRLLDIFGIRNYTVNVTPTTIEPTTSEVTVSIDVPFSENSFFVPFFAGGLTIEASATLYTESHNLD